MSSTTTPKKKKGAKDVVKVIIDIVLWVFLIFSFAMTVLAFSAQASNAGFPKIGDTCLLTVQTPSMAEPGGFYVGDLILGKALTDEEKKTLEVGDVITYYMDLDPADGVDHKELNTHRIIRVATKSDTGEPIYFTKGDHNVLEDKEPINWDVIEAKWTGKRFAGLGAVIGFLQSSKGFLICVVMPLLLFFVYEIFVLVNTVTKIKNKGKRQISDADEELIKQRAIEEYLRQQQAAAQQNNTSEENKDTENK